MQIKSIIINYIHYLNFISFSICSLFHYIFSEFTLLKLGASLSVLYAVKFRT